MCDILLQNFSKLSSLLRMKLYRDTARDHGFRLNAAVVKLRGPRMSWSCGVPVVWSLPMSSWKDVSGIGLSEYLLSASEILDPPVLGT